MKKYTIIAGINGTGKSSFTGVLKTLTNDLGIIIDVDKLAVEHGGNNLKAGRTALAQMNDFCSRGITFTQETTLCGNRTEKTVRLARENGYTIRLYYIGLNSSEESLKRIKNRVEKGGHNIPEEDVKRRYAIRFEALRRILPYCDEVYFYDNDNGFVQVAEYRNGEMICTVPVAPRWLKELTQDLEKVNVLDEEEELNIE